MVRIHTPVYTSAAKAVFAFQICLKYTIHNICNICSVVLIVSETCPLSLDFNSLHSRANKLVCLNILYTFRYGV
jgi:hypothetical protein